MSYVSCCSYFLSYSETAVLTMSVTPGYFNPPHFWVWTALSHCFLEIHFWEVLVDIFTVVLVGKLIGILPCPLYCPVFRIRRIHMFLGLPYP
jgi:hypothetical protein